MAKQTTTKKKAHKKSAAASKNTVTQETVIQDTAQAASTPAEPVETTKKSLFKFKKRAQTDGVTTQTSVGRMVRWYKWLGALFLAESFVVAFLSKEVSAPLAMQYPAVDALASEASGHQVLALASRHLGDVQLGWVVATFLILFAVISLVMATVYRPYLERSLARGINAFRWLGLGLGGGLMVVTIAMVSGFVAVPVLLALLLLTFTGAMLALGAEVLTANNKGVKTRFAHFLCGLAVLASGTPWVIFALSVVGAALWHGHFTSYLYSIYACQFALAVAVMTAVHFRLKRKGRWADAYYTERGFLLLSFVAASLLALQVFVGVLR